jgi:hypothetical protein
LFKRVALVVHHGALVRHMRRRLRVAHKSSFRTTTINIIGRSA